MHHEISILPVFTLILISLLVFAVDQAAQIEADAVNSRVHGNHGKDGV
jgi:hypothetical protein